MDSTGEEYQTAQDVINDTLDDTSQQGVDAPTIYRKMEDRAEGLEEEERARVDLYVRTVRDETSDVLINKDEARIGGTFDGSRKRLNGQNMKLDDNTDGAVTATLDRTESFDDHETYHERNKHLDPLKDGASADGNVKAVVGGVGLENPIEGLTVLETDPEGKYVSDTYVRYMGQVRSAMNRAGLSIEDFRHAINEEKDLGLLDDKTREGAQLSLAA